MRMGELPVIRSSPICLPKTSKVRLCRRWRNKRTEGWQVGQSSKQGNQFMERNEVQTLRKLELVVNGLLIAVALLTIVGVAWGLDTQDIIAPPFASRH